MRKVREILRMKYELSLPHRSIARALHVSIGTVSEYLMSWSLNAGKLGDEQQDGFGRAATEADARDRDIDACACGPILSRKLHHLEGRTSSPRHSQRARQKVSELTPEAGVQAMVHWGDGEDGAPRGFS